MFGLFVIEVSSMWGAAGGAIMFRAGNKWIEYLLEDMMKDCLENGGEAAGT